MPCPCGKFSGVECSHMYGWWIGGKCDAWYVCPFVCLSIVGLLVCLPVYHIYNSNSKKRNALPVQCVVSSVHSFLYHAEFPCHAIQHHVCQSIPSAAKIMQTIYPFNVRPASHRGSHCHSYSRTDTLVGLA